MIASIFSIFTSFFSNIKDYLIIIGVILALILGGYVWYKLSSDEAKIASLTTANAQLQTAVSSLEKAQNSIITDITMIQQETNKANTAIQTIQTNAAKNAVVINNTDYKSQADANSQNLTNTVNANTNAIFGQIEQSSTGTQNSQGTSK